MLDSPIAAGVVAVLLGLILGANLSFQTWLQHLATADRKRGAAPKPYYNLVARLAFAGVSFAIIFAVAFIIRFGTGLPRSTFEIACFGTAAVTAPVLYFTYWRRRR